MGIELFADEIELLPEQQQLLELDLKAAQANYDDYLAQKEEFKNFTDVTYKSLGIAQNPDGTLRNMTTEEYASSLPTQLRPLYDVVNRYYSAAADAVSGELTQADRLQYQKEFDTFKENAARFGTDISGDNAQTGFARTTAGQEGLRNLAISQGTRAEESRLMRSQMFGNLANQSMGLFGSLRQNEFQNLATAPNRYSSVLSGNAGNLTANTLQNLQNQNAAINQANSSGIFDLIGTGAGFVSSLF